jgi:hypothetical protein
MPGTCRSARRSTRTSGSCRYSQGTHTLLAAASPAQPSPAQPSLPNQLCSLQCTVCHTVYRDVTSVVGMRGGFGLHHSDGGGGGGGGGGGCSGGGLVGGDHAPRGRTLERGARGSASAEGFVRYAAEERCEWRAGGCRCRDHGPCVTDLLGCCWVAGLVLMYIVSSCDSH